MSTSRMSSAFTTTSVMVMIIFTITTILTANVNVVEAGMNERFLIKTLLDKLNPLERPVANESESLNVQFGITLQQIIEIDEKNQIFIANIWLQYKWIDSNLVWNPEEYGNVTSVRISPDKLWIPDVLMYNSADERFDSTFRTNVVVNHTGGCLFVPPGIFKSTCRIDITWFPFDNQNCQLKFGSWTYSGYFVNLTNDEDTADLSSYVPNGEWVLMSVPAERHVLYYECCGEEPYIDVTFSVNIQRRTLYYGFNLIIPCIILSSMTLLGFSLPPESGEKLHLGVTILLSMTVFLVQLGKILPATSDSVSIIAIYFGSIMLMVSFSVVMTVIVLNFHHRSYETKEMSPRMRKIFLDILPGILGMDRLGIKPPDKILKSNQTTLKDRIGSKLRKSELKKSNTLNKYSGEDKTLPPYVPEFGMGEVFEMPPMSSMVCEHGAQYNLNEPGGGVGGCLYNEIDDLDVSVTITDNESDIMMRDPSLMTPKSMRAAANGKDRKAKSSGVSVAEEHHRVHHEYLSMLRRYKLIEILLEVQVITNKIREEDRIKDLVAEWRYAATVLDRVCLIVFTLFTILSLAICLISAPQLIV